MAQVVVAYNNMTEISDIVEQINTVKNPHIILWYIGTKGLKKQSVDFHKQIIDPIYKKNSNARFWLYDLTAWGALKDSNLSISKYSRHITKINMIDRARISCIQSSDIFKKMQEITDERLIEHFQKSLSKDFIWKSSQDFPSSNLRIKDLFANNCPLLTKYYNHDTNHGYSMLQYLEGCLLVDEIVNLTINALEEECLKIFFVLPNDEIKYYQDITDYFKRDIEFLIIQRYGAALRNIKIMVNFYSFKYGEFAYHRPYNGAGDSIKPHELHTIHMLNE